MFDMFDLYLDEMLRESMKDKLKTSGKKKDAEDGVKSERKEDAEDKSVIRKRIEENSDGIASTEEALNGVTYSVALGHAHGEDRVVLELVSYNKRKVEGIQFNSLVAAAMSLEDNRNDWYKLLVNTQR